MSNNNQTSLQPLAHEIANTILKGFNRHFEIFQSITSGARARFEAADWRAVHSASRERIVLYDRRVAETIDLVKKLHGDEHKAVNEALWKLVKLSYMQLLVGHKQPALAETFYNSVFCHQSPREYYTQDFIFLRNGVSSDYIEGEEPNYLCYYPMRDGLKNCIRKMIDQADFTLPFEDIERDIRSMYRAIVKFFPKKANRKPALNFQLRVIPHAFYRNKAAYIVGRIMNGRTDIGFSLAILNNEEGALYVDTLLLGEKQLSVVFSYSQAYFMLSHEVPSSVVSFLRAIIPGRTQSELYSSIGFHKQGKSDFYRDFLHHLSHSYDEFVIAPGIRGMVMMVFTLPSYNYVFKIIKDKFAPQKEFTRKVVEEKYQLVKRHDRVGRMADMLEYSEVSIPLDRIHPDLLQELHDTCESSIREVDGNLVFKHIYIERRMIPLNIYMESANDEELAHVIRDYGCAIKQLAAANIFPGDFLYKNFGVTRQGRVVFYDYDEINYMTECNFRKIPPPRFPEDMFSAEPWYSIEPFDVFPEEFGTFLLTNPKVKKTFMEYHADLLEADYWSQIQKNIKQYVYEDVYPYSKDIRFKR